MKTYIMCWNPGISSAKLFDYNAARNKWPGGFRGDWSIYVQNRPRGCMKRFLLSNCVN